MFNFNKLKIGKRFIIIFSLIIIITASGLFFLMYNMTDQRHEVDSIYLIRFIGIENLIEADRDAYQSSIAISHAFNDYFSKRTVQKKQMDTYIESINENLLQVNDRFTKFEKLYLDSGAEKVPEFDIMNKHYKKLFEHSKTINKRGS